LILQLLRNTLKRLCQALRQDLNRTCPVSLPVVSLQITYQDKYFSGFSWPTLAFLQVDRAESAR